MGRTWYIPISNARTDRWWKAAFCPNKDVPKCHIHGDFTLCGKLLNTYDWKGDIAPISLPANSEPYLLECINKREGYEKCGIVPVPMSDNERLPLSSMPIIVIFSVIEGGIILGTHKYYIKNIGVHLDDLIVYGEDQTPVLVT
ncbi:MAG: hypothetical protein WB588_07020 [Dehalococcoidia bacterium]